MVEVYVNDIKIPDSDIVKISEPAEEKLQFNFSNLISAKISVDIVNIDKSKYDDTYAGALFNTLVWFNATLKIIDTSLDLIIWEGRIKNLKRNEGKKVLTIESTNYIKDIIDTTCVLTLGGLSNVTPAEMVYTILKDVVGIPETAIHKTSFDNAKAIQAANSGYIILNYTAENNIKCSAVINEILRITSSSLYTINNIIYYHQFSVYAGGLNTLIDESNIITSTFTDEYNSDNIFNDYKVAYKSSDTVVAFASPGTTPSYITLSKSKYGTRYFNVPDEDQGSTTPADFKILLKSQNSALYYGGLVLASSHYQKKICKFNITNDFTSKIYLNTLIDVDYENLVREPMRIIERKINKKDLSVTAEMLNFPYAGIERDKIKPEAVKLVSVINDIDNKVRLQWTKSEDGGFGSYQVEFTTSPSDFTNTYSNEGYSPILLETPEMLNGLCTMYLTGFLNSAKYYFRIKVRDSAGNIGIASNILTLDVQYNA